MLHDARIRCLPIREIHDGDTLIVGRRQKLMLKPQRAILQLTIAMMIEIIYLSCVHQRLSHLFPFMLHATKEVRVRSHLYPLQQFFY